MADASQVAPLEAEFDEAYGRFFRKERFDEAVHGVCDYLDGSDLTLYERWRVCHCIALSAMQCMAPGLREFAERARKLDFDAIREPVES